MHVLKLLTVLFVSSVTASSGESFAFGWSVATTITKFNLVKFTPAIKGPEVLAPSSQLTLLSITSSVIGEMVPSSVSSTHASVTTIVTYEPFPSSGMTIQTSIPRTSTIVVPINTSPLSVPGNASMTSETPTSTHSDPSSNGNFSTIIVTKTSSQISSTGKASMSTSTPKPSGTPQNDGGYVKAGITVVMGAFMVALLGT